MKRDPLRASMPSSMTQATDGYFTFMQPDLLKMDDPKVSKHSNQMLKSSIFQFKQPDPYVRSNKNFNVTS